MNTMVRQIGWVLLFYVPTLIVLVGIIRMKRTHDTEARQPFTERPLRLAGESTRSKADRLFESATDDLLFIMLGCPLLGLLCSNLPERSRFLISAGVFFLVTGGASVFGLRLRRKLKKSWEYRLGAKGEQVVGRELDRLMAQGYRVFHDVPFPDWNIDHVVVGSKGVFAVETKAWRKPSKEAALKAEMIFDGETLIRPCGWRDGKTVAQARINAESLSTWIEKAAGERISAIPIIALPGWSLKIQRFGDVGVFSATNMSEHILKRGKSNLSTAEIQRIAFQLTKLCEQENT